MRWSILYEVFMVLLIVTYGIVLLTPTGQNPLLTEQHIEIFDWSVLAILAVEYVYSFWRNKDKKKFIIRHGWEIIALLPLDPSFRLVRLLRFARLFALIRTSPLVWEIVRSPALLRILGFTSVVILWSSVGIFMMENGINDHIQTFGDAIWWSIVTTTTVGYGDISPVSIGGRIIAVFLMITGIGMIGTLMLDTMNLLRPNASHAKSGETSPAQYGGNTIKP
jgi:voltage-gated potassium channel